MGDGAVDEHRPQHHERHEGAEPPAVGGGTGDEGGGDHGEHHLEEREDQWGDDQSRGTGEARDGLVHVCEPGEVQIAHEPVPLAEGERVAHGYPDHTHQGDGDEVLHDHREDMPGTNHATVEEGDPGRHEQHERSARQHPGSRARVNVREIEPHWYILVLHRRHR